jgi:hypothetical protein
MGSFSVKNDAISCMKTSHALHNIYSLHTNEKGNKTEYESDPHITFLFSNSLFLFSRSEIRFEIPISRINS